MITRTVRDEGVLRTYHRLVCTCGTSGEGHPLRALAVADREAHVVEVAAPHEERCRHTPTHTSGWWEVCFVCRDQMALF